MKIKRTILLVAPAILLASCNPSKATTSISKIDLSGAKTLIMGKLSTSNSDEQLISVDEDGNATETKVEVKTGETKTETSDITISRLVKINKEYAIVSCKYNDVIYHVIVNLTDGTCVKFPDYSLLPNTKQRLGGHRAYRKYQKQYGYLNSSIIQPNEDVKLFYYVNHYQCDEADSTVYARRLVELDLTGDTPTAKAIVTPSDNHSVQTFAVDNEGRVIYIASEDEKVIGSTVFDEPKLHYEDKKDDVVVTYNTNNYESIAPTLITGSDGLIYCYLKMKSKNNYVMASINIDTTSETVTATANPVEAEGEETSESYPEKVFNIKGTDSKNVETVNTVSVTKTSKINQLFSFSKQKKNDDNLDMNYFGKPKPSPSPYKKKENDKPKESEVEVTATEQALESIEDGYSGNNYAYLFGKVNSKSKARYLKKCEYKNGKYTYVKTILETYFTSGENDIDTIETDEATDDTTIVVVNSDDSETVVVVDEETGKEDVVENVSDVTDVVDVNN